MSSLIQSQVFLFMAVAIILFLPGYFLLLAIFGKTEKTLFSFERFVLSFGISLTITNFIAFSFSRLGIPITAFSAVGGSLVFSAVCASVFWLKRRRQKDPSGKLDVKYAARQLAEENNELFSFTSRQYFLIALLIFTTIFIRTAYLSGTVAPTSTDMGHHMYWTKSMVESQTLPTYDGMPDFIIGEHVALGEIAMISGLSLFGALPVVFLLLINILSILTVFILVLRIFENKNVAILSLFFLGVLFAVSSPQAKFISGGVMGNIMGNFFTPLIFYFLYRAMAFLKKSDKKDFSPEEISRARLFLALGVLSIFGIFYTHHLSAFIFLFSSTFLVVLFLAVNHKEFKFILTKTFSLVFSWPVILTLTVGLIFFFGIFTPTYLEPSAVGTAVGAPSKATREGLSLTGLKSSVGEPRAALAFIGLLLLAFSYRRRNFGYAIIAGWSVMIFLMSTQPRLLFINLPSSRIGNYLVYPAAILAAYGLAALFDKERFRPVSAKFASGAFLIIFAYTLTSGLRDSADSFKKAPDFTPTLQTFNASRYLATHATEDEGLLKDHNYLSGDTWMKLYFMRGYTYPLSRSYFKRYEDPTKPREMCTLQMISVPDEDEARRCFEETGTRFVMINPRYDSSQFNKLENFDLVYSSGGVGIYYRK